MKRRFSQLSGHPDRGLIDFPVSKIWRDYYRRSGYTNASGPYPPTHGQNRPSKQEIQELWDRVLMLESHSILMESALRRILVVLDEGTEREKGGRRPKKR
jgi:hypothetical protein